MNIFSYHYNLTRKISLDLQKSKSSFQKSPYKRGNGFDPRFGRHFFFYFLLLFSFVFCLLFELLVLVLEGTENFFSSKYFTNVTNKLKTTHLARKFDMFFLIGLNITPCQKVLKCTENRFLYRTSLKISGCTEQRPYIEGK